MSSFFVMVISSTGVPRQLFGTYVDLSLAESMLFEVLQSKNLKNDFDEELDDELREEIRMDGFYEFVDGGGVYIVQSENFYDHSSDDDENQDS